MKNAILRPLFRSKNPSSWEYSQPWPLIINKRLDLALTISKDPCFSEMAENVNTFRLISLKTWPLRLSVRTSGFHPGKRSSTLLGVTTKIAHHFGGLFSWSFSAWVELFLPQREALQAKGYVHESLTQEFIPSKG